MDTESQQVQSTNDKLIVMDETNPDETNPGTPLDKGSSTENCYMTIVTAFPRLEKVYSTAEKLYSTEVKPTIEALRKKFESIPFSYETIEQHSTILHLIHGVCLMLCGGSWVWLATLMSFYEVFKVYNVVISLTIQGKGSDMETTLKSLHQVWLLMVVYYGIWSIPLLSKITIAFMLEKFITGTIFNPAIMAHLEERLPLELVFGRWCPFVMKVTIRFVLVFLSVFTYNIQVCLVMACIGYQKLSSSFTEGLCKQIDGIEGPFKLNGNAVTLWASVIVCTVWQFWHGYESSFLGMIVPLGFLVMEKKVKSI